MGRPTVIVRRRTRRGIGCACVLAALAVTAGAVFFFVIRPGPSSGFAGTAATRPDAAWNALFQGYRNLSGAWRGGAGAQSLVMPDGSTMWFFADTFLGATEPSGTRA